MRSVFAFLTTSRIIGADLTYLNFIVGVAVMFCFIPVQTWFYAQDRKKHCGHNRPEARFITSLVTVWLFPITLLWFAFTSDGNVSYWSPVVAGGVLGFADPLLWLSMLNYITGGLPLHPSHPSITHTDTRAIRCLSQRSSFCDCCVPDSFIPDCCRTCASGCSDV
jgi:hypothetical protein